MTESDSPRPKLSVIVNFFNMQREAARTLYTLSTRYQRDVSADDYEVIAVDNGSTAPLDIDHVEAFEGHFRYLRIETDSPSPCAAINQAVASARGENVMICIDGARMLSPGIIKYALAALALHPHSFVHTLGMHLGPKPQNESVDEGYDQRAEDELLKTVDWRQDGYRLFTISSLARSSSGGFFRPLSESNCFALPRADYLALGGMDEKFVSPGGGLVNLDFFNLANEQSDFRPIMLLGEATFHQFHGGVATNVSRCDLPWPSMVAEYALIRGKEFVRNSRAPEYLGWFSADCHSRFVSLQR